jgi:hypothetical protein
MKSTKERGQTADPSATAAVIKSLAEHGKGPDLKPQCSAITRLGARCPNPALPNSGFCFTHDPSLAEQRATGRHRGGLGRRNVIRAQKAMPKDARDVADLLLWALHATATGEINPTILTALSSGARAYLEITRGATLESRFAEIEELLRNQAKAA